MTAQEMHTAVKIEVDKLDSLNYPNLQPEEIDYHLNKSSERFIKHRYQQFEEAEKRMDDLKNITKNVEILPDVVSVDNKVNGRFVTLPTGVDAYWFAINEEAVINYTDCHGATIQATVEVKPLQHDDYNKTVKDPFNKPIVTSQVQQLRRLQLASKMEILLPANVGLEKYILRYIRKPSKISLALLQDSDLADHTHQEIVDMAVSTILETIESGRYPTNLNELKKLE